MTKGTKSEGRETAVVLGASISGLLAARVLADHYGRVILVERDVPPDLPVTRRGVPQSGLPHILAARGMRIVGELFPGLSDELVAGGARVWNDGDLSRLCVCFAGHQLLRSGTIPDPESIVIHFAHRPFIEWNLRRRVDAIPHVQTLPAHDLVRLTSPSRGDRVTGVIVALRDSGAQTTLMADLVVDATGRGSRTPRFLHELGYERPREDELPVHVAYAGLPVYVPPGTLRENIAFSAPKPSYPVGYAMFAGENDIYKLAVQTIAGRQPPTDHASLLTCLADIAPPHVLAAARCAEPLDEVVQYRFPSNRWRRYDKLGRIPDGLVVVGDALCNFNPLYGHGMSMAAIEALVLRDCLQEGPPNLPRRFYRQSAKEIRIAWQAAVGSDLALPQIPGRRPISIRVANAYLEHVLAAGESDAAVVQQFLRLINMLDPPSRLLHPPTLLRVLNRSRKRIAAGRTTKVNHA
ncbi:hydroxylase [Mycobacterium kubicae]|uniref:Hydroxylase n=1 Tax=Mycobacterium kubicae TaxID=120959 RepID=A0AAX1JDC3_9MYCO|nr:2-polyprenyl-6-methoxyphenol hydroxylase-like oxidoreductase [Mycobacterium kubicae]MCV7098573.1 2-polyprenyl-6-methoxyphenol hydroxylase-like oxidoreductase [Mycobacterium kubicae]ORV95846.1 2-polyprenyl-6-methoxyphenol hydroxylase-like oxidoreductase [Mycobacterium kubicae]QNI11013.1 2-polyprenyl-6-methoxyphenol hydroxylase-like oxidoreductase [Mycobacterium kubicae]QPI39227.1 2-polyprenyl-6-methoxyphenol hydroxylase-like oxidoreductase [Mycobacterium kubicae]GFG63768.1 hydroxylase [Mycob